MNPNDTIFFILRLGDTILYVVAIAFGCYMLWRKFWEE